MKEQIIAALEQIRPFLQRDGGDVEFVEYDENKNVFVRLQGHCAGCPHAQATVKGVIEEFLKENFGEAINSVESVR